VLNARTHDIHSRRPDIEPPLSGGAGSRIPGDEDLAHWSNGSVWQHKFT